MAFTPTYTPPEPPHEVHTVLQAVLILTVIVFLGFGSLVGYYIWQIKNGEVASLASQFSDAFSDVTGEGTTGVIPTLTIPAQTLERTHNPTLGEPDAPIRLTMFIDFECPFCQRGYPITRELIERYGDALRVVFKHMPLTGLHPGALRAHLAATCAYEQQAFWPYYDLLFTTRDLSEEALLRHAQTLGLDTNVFSSCLDNARYQKDIEQDVVDGIQVGVRGTPTYFINQTRLQGVLPIETWESVILEELQSL